jgi:hypothetical protein
MCTELEKWHGMVVVTAHGNLFTEPFENVRSCDGFPCLGDVKESAWVHCPGTGVMAYDPRRVSFSFGSDFTSANADDFQAGIACQKRKTPVRVIAHEKGWLTTTWDGPSVWKNEIATGFVTRRAILRAFPEWRLYELREMVEGPVIRFRDEAARVRLTAMR